LDEITIEQLQSRKSEIERLFGAMQAAWPFFLQEIKRREAEMIQRLVTVNDDELRGRIKELQRLKELPSDLRVELDDIGAALSETDAAI